MVNSASVVVAVWGTRYNPYIARWWESLRNLKTQPNEIVVVSDKDSELHATIPDWVAVPVVKIEADLEYYQQWWDLAFTKATQDYIIGLPIDDQFHSEALDFLQETDADLIIDNCTILQGGEWLGNWDTQATYTRRFAPASISPFSRRIAILYGQMPKETYWDDYVFYLLAVKAGVSIYKTDKYRMIHDLGADHETVSGLNMKGSLKPWADNQLAEIRQALQI